MTHRKGIFMNGNFELNTAFYVGVLLNCVALLWRHFLPEGSKWRNVATFLQGGAVALMFLGLLYGLPKTRPLFDGVIAFKNKLLGR